MNNALIKQLTSLTNMPAQELRAMWKELGMGDSLHFNKQHLVKRIAYRLQELALGGESISYIRRMEALARGKAKANTKAATRPITGTRLIREYQGEEHQVSANASAISLPPPSAKACGWAGAYRLVMVYY